MRLADFQSTQAPGSLLHACPKPQPVFTQPRFLSLNLVPFWQFLALLDFLSLPVKSRISSTAKACG